jgi:hypothetical protein
LAAAETAEMVLQIALEILVQILFFHPFLLLAEAVVVVLKMVQVAQLK